MVTSVLGSGGPVVVVPTGVLTNGASTSTGTEATLTTTIGTVTTSGSGSGGGGSCAQGWYSCPANNGGGCCPSGYVCGASCTASVSGGGSVGKIAAGGASPRKEGMGLLGTLLVGVAMVLMGVGVGM